MVNMVLCFNSVLTGILGGAFVVKVYVVVGTMFNTAYRIICVYQI